MSATPTEEQDRDDQSKRREPRKRDIFDVATFILGAYGFLHELLAGDVAERWGILVMSGVLMGLGKSLDVLADILKTLRGDR